MVRTPHLCITSPWNYPLFNPECQSHFGGWEVRVALIAKELARRRNFRVSLIVGDHGQPHVEQRDGVTLYSWIGREIWGIPFRKPSMTAPEARYLNPGGAKPAWWRFLWAKARARRVARPIEGQIGSYSVTPDMVSIYDEVGADIYMVPGNSQFSGEAAFYARQRNKKYVFLSGSDLDYYPEYKHFKDKLDMYSVPYALKCFAIENAAAHIVQNRRQADMLRDGYGREATAC